jgi:hypothetical protein
MPELISAITKYGLVPVVLAVVIYMVLRGEINFRYPRRKP